MGTARLLLQAHQGRVVRPETLTNMRKSRKITTSKAIRLPEFLASFQDAEWGLGLQLVPPPGNCKDGSNASSFTDVPAWGHISHAGSFGLVIPGRRPVIAVLNSNRLGSAVLAEEVLRVLWLYTHCKPLDVY